jgi:hypothetical protein
MYKDVHWGFTDSTKNWNNLSRELVSISRELVKLAALPLYSRTQYKHCPHKYGQSYLRDRDWEAEVKGHPELQVRPHKASQAWWLKIVTVAMQEV